MLVCFYIFIHPFSNPTPDDGAGIPVKSNLLSFSLSLSDFELPTSFHVLCKKK